jgi:hypothetical protein
MRRSGAVLRRACLAALAGTVTAAVTLGLAAPADARQGASLEYPVKANYLVKFAAFVQWPPSALPPSSSVMTLCIVGDDPFGASLDRAAAGQALDGRRLVVRRLERIDARSGCQIAYLGRSRRQSVAQALGALENTPVLTVTDSARGDERGVIHFAVSGNRVRFYIDDRSASRTGLSISSRLLSLALSVRSRGAAA